MSSSACHGEVGRAVFHTSSQLLEFDHNNCFLLQANEVMATKDEVTFEELSQTAVDPATLNIAAGVALTDLQRRHVAVVLDLWQRRGTRAKLEENFVEDVLYEDHFAVCKDRKEFGALFSV